MAPSLYRDQREARAFVCHVWLSLSCIIFAAVFFGVSSLNSAFLFVGVVFLVLSLVVFTLYFVCRRRQRGEDKGDKCCTCFECCEFCLRNVLGLGRNRRNSFHHPRSPARMTTNLHRLSAHMGQDSTMQGFRGGSPGGGYENFAMVNSPVIVHHSQQQHTNDNVFFPPGVSSSTASPTPPPAELRAHLRHLEGEVNELLMDCSRVQENALGALRGMPARERSLRRSDRELADIHASLGTEFGLLCTWIENNRHVPFADLERMRSGLDNLRRRLRLVENGVRTRPTSSVSLHHTQPTEMRPSQESIVGVASLTVPLPPTMLNMLPNDNIRTSSTFPLGNRQSTQSPLPTTSTPSPSISLTEIGGGPTTVGGLEMPPPYREFDEPSRDFRGATTRGRNAAGSVFEIIGQPNTEHFRLPYYLVPPPIEPPSDESGAPPSYEEASSSQV